MPPRSELCARIGRRIGLPGDEVARSMHLIQGGAISLHAAPAEDANSPRLEETLADGSASPEEAVILRLDHAKARKRIMALTREILGERERAVFLARCMTGGDDITHLDSLAKDFGVSRERIYQLEASAKRKIAAALAQEGLQRLHAAMVRTSAPRRCAPAAAVSPRAAAQGHAAAAKRRAILIAAARRGRLILSLPHKPQVHTPQVHTPPIAQSAPFWRTWLAKFVRLRVVGETAGADPPELWPSAPTWVNSGTRPPSNAGMRCCRLLPVGMRAGLGRQGRRTAPGHSVPDAAQRAVAPPPWPAAPAGCGAAVASGTGAPVPGRAGIIIQRPLDILRRHVRAQDLPAAASGRRPWPAPPRNRAASSRDAPGLLGQRPHHRAPRRRVAASSPATAPGSPGRR